MALISKISQARQIRGSEVYYDAFGTEETSATSDLTLTSAIVHGATYSFVIDTQTITYDADVSGAGDTASTVYKALADSANGNVGVTTAYFTYDATKLYVIGASGQGLTGYALSDITLLTEANAVPGVDAIGSGSGYVDQSWLDANAEAGVFLEDDLNMIRLQLNRIIGETNWYDEPNTTLADASGTAGKLIIQPVQVNALTVAAGTVDTGLTSGTVGFVGGSTLGYVVVDESDFIASPTIDTKAIVGLRDATTNMPLIDVDENEIFGVLVTELVDGDAITASGDVRILTYKDVAGTATAVSYAGTVEALLPQRVALADANENFAMINAGFAGAVGSIELGDRSWVELDATDGTYKLVTGVTGENAELGLTQNVSMTDAINALIPEAQIARDTADALLTLTGGTVNTDSDWDLATSLTTAWDGDGAQTNTFYLDGSVESDFLLAFKTLDNELHTVQLLAENASPETVVTIVASPVSSGVSVTVASGKTYDSADQDAMAVFVNGQKLVSDAIVGGAAGSGDYTEIDNTTVTFSFNLTPNDVITYEIRKAV
jgi:hypothetical protein